MYLTKIDQNQALNDPFHPRNNQAKKWEKEQPSFDELKPLIDRVLQKPLTDSKILFKPRKNWSFSQCLEEAVQLEKIDAYVINRLLYKISDINSFCYFYKNTPYTLTDTIFFATAIKKADQLKAFAQAKAAFYEAKERDLVNDVTFNSYITAAGHAHQFVEAKAAFLKALEKDLADEVTFSSYITAAGKANQFKEAKDAFLEARTRGLANEVTYASYITAAGNTHQFEEAKAAFLEAEKEDLANKVTFSSYISAAGKTNQFEEAKTAFEEAKERNLVDKVTFTSYITAAGYAHQFEEAKAAFLEATERNRVDAVTYFNYIDVLIAENQIDEAMKIYHQHIRPKVPVKKTSSGLEIYLSGLSHETAKICVLECLNSLTPQQQVRFITRLGQQSASDKLFEMKSLIKELLSDKNVTLLEEKEGSLLFEVNHELTAGKSLRKN